ncbi:uncharacterized protein LOC5516579 [Nematostella vectensis]|uniref:uncharacterized protein LOC5516579 n=1 Tax=Nematostella vectensis TaxID=45351 RepID=UPI0020775A10|nr:uncharacterized protein LOC5516579 [Nematostella vectensis]XP_032242304.2 uncharacterized protein LOC5516579 [Nematostella vectensis]
MPSFGCCIGFVPQLRFWQRKSKEQTGDVYGYKSKKERNEVSEGINENFYYNEGCITESSDDIGYLPPMRENAIFYDDEIYSHAKERQNVTWFIPEMFSDHNEESEYVGKNPSRVVSEKQEPGTEVYAVLEGPGCDDDYQSDHEAETNKDPSVYVTLEQDQGPYEVGYFQQGTEMSHEARYSVHEGPEGTCLYGELDISLTEDHLYQGLGPSNGNCDKDKEEILSIQSSSAPLFQGHCPSNCEQKKNLENDTLTDQAQINIDELLETIGFYLKGKVESDSLGEEGCPKGSANSTGDDEMSHELHEETTVSEKKSINSHCISENIYFELERPEDENMPHQEAMVELDCPSNNMIENIYHVLENPQRKESEESAVYIDSTEVTGKDLEDSESHDVIYHVLENPQRKGSEDFAVSLDSTEVTREDLGDSESHDVIYHVLENPQRKGSEDFAVSLDSTEVTREDLGDSESHDVIYHVLENPQRKGSEDFAVSLDSTEVTREDLGDSKSHDVIYHMLENPQRKGSEDFVVSLDSTEVTREDLGDSESHDVIYHVLENPQRKGSEDFAVSLDSTEVTRKDLGDSESHDVIYHVLEHQEQEKDSTRCLHSTEVIKGDLGKSEKFTEPPNLGIGNFYDKDIIETSEIQDEAIYGNVYNGTVMVYVNGNEKSETSNEDYYLNSDENIYVNKEIIDENDFTESSDNLKCQSYEKDGANGYHGNREDLNRNRHWGGVEQEEQEDIFVDVRELLTAEQRRLYKEAWRKSAPI